MNEQPTVSAPPLIEVCPNCEAAVESLSFHFDHHLEEWTCQPAAPQPETREPQSFAEDMALLYPGKESDRLVAKARRRKRLIDYLASRRASAPEGDAEP